MPTAQLSAIDGDFDSELQIAPTGREYPFGNDPQADVYARVHERTMEIAMESFLPAIGTLRAYFQRITYSNVLSNGAWTQTGTAVTPATERTPWDGAQTVDQLEEDTSTGVHNINRAFTYATVPILGIRQRYWLSAIVALDPISAPRYICLRAVDASSGYYQTFFNPWTGVMMNTAATGASAASVLARVIKLPPGAAPAIVGSARQFYWIALGFKPSAGVGSLSLGFSQDAATLSYTGPGSGGGPVYVAQIQLGGGSLFTSDSDLGPLILSDATARSVLAGPVDEADPFAFLVAESKPSAIEGEIYQFVRTYARIPADQVKPGSRLFSRPVLDGVKSGTYYAAAFGDKRTSHIWNGRKAITSLAALSAHTVTTTPTASFAHDLITIQAYTLTAKTFYADDSDATILLALSQAIYNDNVHNTTTYFQLLRNADSLTVGCVAVILIALSSSGATTEVAMAGGNSLGILGSNGERFRISAKNATSTATDSIDPSIRTVAATAHGGVVGDNAAFWAGDALYSLGLVLTVPDADHFTVSLETLPGKDATVTHCAFSSDADLCVVNGAKMCDVRHTTRHYLPGYTAGITTDADIPKQPPQIDAPAWLAAIVAGTAWPVYEVGEVGQYKGSILQQETITLQLSDALDTETP